MQVFINEASLCAQYNSPYHFYEAVKLFLSTLKRIDEIKDDKCILKSQNFYYSPALSNTLFTSVLKADRVLCQTFYANIDRVNPKCWEKDKCHDESSKYEFSGEDYVGTSVAELTERKIRTADLNGFLMNFMDSPFGDSATILVSKNNSNPIYVDCATTPEAIDDWLISHGFLNPEEGYSESSRWPPRDYQTVLRDRSIFEKTNYHNHRRMVYKRIGTNELWCVDNMHIGVKAHIEVFDCTTCRHIGISSINEIRVDNSRRVPGPTIDLS